MTSKSLFNYVYGELASPSEDIKKNFEEKYNKVKSEGFDIVKLARELGIYVFKSDDLGDKVSGMIEYDGFNFNIYLNSKNSIARNIFTIAHEIAHFVCDNDEIKQGAKFRDGDYKIKLDDTNRAKEVRANQMAADMLMPREEFIKLWNDGKTIKDLIKIFKVSEDAIKVRANYLLGIIW